MKKGSVILAGAGPGDPELITLKLKEALKEADIVLSDYLVPQSLRTYLKKGARWIDVGKSGMKDAGRNTKQAEINALMIEFADKGNLVLRLKGGDPFVFGRGGEECDILTKRRIKFKIIPGISSIFSSALFAGIPLTHRDLSRSFAIITGHPRGDLSPDAIHIPNVDTLVIGMGLKNIDNIVKKILAAGKSPSTPAAIIYKASTPEQKIFLTKVREIKKTISNYNIVSPSTIIIGDVAKLAKKNNWATKKSLNGIKILLTRQRVQSKEFFEKLIAFGAEVDMCSMIDICHRENICSELKALNPFSQYTDVIFTSANAVNIFFNNLLKTGADVRKFSEINVISIGKSTSAKLRSFGLLSDLEPKQMNSKAILKLLPDDLSGRHFMLPGAKVRYGNLKEEIVKRRGKATSIVLYETKAPDKRPEIDVKSYDVISFASVSAIQNFLNYYKAESVSGHVLAIGLGTANELKKSGFKNIATAKEATVDGMIKKVIAITREKTKCRN